MDCFLGVLLKMKCFVHVAAQVSCLLCQQGFYTFSSRNTEPRAHLFVDFGMVSE